MHERPPAVDDGERYRTLLEGQVIGPCVAELARVCASAMSDRRALTIDLARVSFVGHEGAALLRRLRSGGVALANCSPLVAEELKAHGERTG